MNIKVDCSNMMRVAFQHRFQNRENFWRPSPWRAVGVPQVPWTQVHDALSIKRCGVEIFWIGLRQIAHGIFESDCLLLAVRIRAVTVPLTEGRDITAFNRGTLRR